MALHRSIITDQTDAYSGHPILRWVSPEDIFNLPLYENYLVIDTRSAESFACGSIATAVSYPVPCDPDATEEAREKSLYEFARRYAAEYYRPENPNPVVVYGEATNTAHAEWLARRLRSLQAQRKSLTVYKQHEIDTSDDLIDPIEQFCQTIADRVKEIWLLHGGYQSFQQAYPFLCGSIGPEEMFPVPHQITEGLMMGSRVVPLTNKCLTKMRISHIVLSKHQDVDWHQLQGIQVLSCDVHDRNREDMTQCWTASYQFIEEARKQGGCVLVCLHGRSRSASIILAYLIKKQQVTFNGAWETLTKKCWHLIDRSLVYEEQLQAWESLTLHAINN